MVKSSDSEMPKKNNSNIPDNDTCSSNISLEFLLFKSIVVTSLLKWKIGIQSNGTIVSKQPCSMHRLN